MGRLRRRLSTREIFTGLAALAPPQLQGTLPDWIVYSQPLWTYLAAGLPFFVHVFVLTYLSYGEL